MKTSDLDVELELLNLPRVIKVLQEVQHFPEVEKGTKDALRNGARYLLRKGRTRLRQRMKSGTKGVTGNLLRSFKYTIKKKNRGVLAGFKGGKGGGNHSWLIDKGTKERYTKKGYFRGRVHRKTGIGNKFWTDTRNSESNNAMRIVLVKLQETVNNIRNRNK
mgnify:FL=1